MLNKVKLANGTEVDWEEFNQWSFRKQSINLIGVSQDAVDKIKSWYAVEENRELHRRNHAGIKPSQESIQKMLATRKARGYDGKGRTARLGWKVNRSRSKPVQTPWGHFPSISFAAQDWQKRFKGTPSKESNKTISFGGLCESIRFKIKTCPAEYYFTSENPK
ncbi:hypothetical protein G6661_05300 [Polynucleobacter paneuropaeus]|nr:hypothetical protein G6661_05300 [Polynucleobacter paneuropaeus]